jgi:YesN/AraC family two-component response regulator
VHSVLLVDDEPFVRLSLASLRRWEEEGFSFRFEAGNGREALAVLAAHPEIDMVLLDITMPVMDGIECLRRIAAGEGGHRDAAPAVIVLSAYDDFHLVRTAFTLGARDYVLKAEMEGDSLLALLRKTAAGIEESRERTSSIIDRTQIEFLRAQTLRDLLAGPAEAGCADVLASLGVTLPPPLTVCGFWIRDFEVVSTRYQAEGLSRFSSMVERSLGQVLAKRGTGEVVVIRPDHAVVILASAGTSDDAAMSFCSDAREYLERYLSVRSQFAVGKTCGSLAEIPTAYRALLEGRGVESRIVVVARRFVREHYTDPGFSLAEIARKAGVSKNHLSWEFARETGETLSEHLARTRIEEAKRLLASTSLHIYEVGERVGYPNVEHFSRVFKKITGKSPSAWPREGDSTET